MTLIECLEHIELIDIDASKGALVAKCKFCELNGVEGEHIAKCRFCKAEFEVQVHHDTGRVRYKVLAEPDDQILNLIEVKKRLKECRKLLPGKGQEALDLLEDIWVELASVMNGRNYYLIDELTRLKKRNKQLEAWQIAVRHNHEGVGLMELHKAHMISDKSMEELFAFVTEEGD